MVEVLAPAACGHDGGAGDAPAPVEHTASTLPENGDDGDGTFLIPADVGPGVFECDPWLQDCDEGSKCMPWANDGGGSWNATRCSEVIDTPDRVGESCEVFGTAVGGVDSCDYGSMCYYVDQQTGYGICVPLCTGGPDAPQCDEGSVCSIANDGVLTLCRRRCDPLVQDCEGLASCLPAAGSDGFACLLDASHGEGGTGTPCEFVNACAPGRFCADRSTVPGCDGTLGCCSQFCDLGASDPDDDCTLDGQACVPWYADGEAPAESANVGACALPL
ncbi:MAG: ribulose phosphate epimerase [Nannocystaceae bacterium]